MVITINIPDSAVQLVQSTIDLLIKLLAIFGGSAMVVKFTGTLPQNHILLPIIKFLGTITNNQTNDEAVRLKQQGLEGGEK